MILVMCENGGDKKTEAAATDTYIPAGIYNYIYITHNNTAIENNTFQSELVVTRPLIIASSSYNIAFYIIIIIITIIFN